VSNDFDHPPFADNLISLKGDLRQQQTAGWTPGAPVHQGLGCTLHADQMIPVAEGISLGADVATPKKEGRYPSVVLFSAYSHELQQTAAPTGTNETGSSAVFTDRGYNHVVVSRRGMGRSQGDSGVFFNSTDVDDHVAVIEWCAKQPWCDGNVVLFGTSYYAMVQPEVAVRRPAALKGFFANGLDTDYFRQVVMFGGAPQVDFLTLWMGANFTETQEKLHVPPLLRAALSHVFNSPLKNLWEPAIQERMVAIQKGFKKHVPARKYRQLFAEWIFDGKTRATNSIPEGPWRQLKQITVPFVAVENTGALNLHQFGAYDLMQNAGTPADRKWLILSPPEYALPVYCWQLEALAFFDHIVYGADNGYAAQAPVRYYVDGTPEGEYRGAPAFPIPGSEKVRYHLSSGGADAAIHHLQNAPPEAGKNSWGAVPFGATVPPELDEVANPILTFEAAMEEDIEFSGSLTLSLCFSCSEIDSHVIARLGRVDASGGYHRLSMGSIRPACRRIDIERCTAVEIALDIDKPEPLVPGEPVTLCFSLTPRPALFKSGERLRLDLGSRTDILRSNPSHGFEQFDMQVPPYFSRNSIHYGEDSYLELERVP
jgi:putative CocE/NonD family hydrolase